jgi:uncharacterized protein (DUF1330 family)
MSACVIAGLAVTQPEAYAEYARGVTATLEPYGGRFIARGGTGFGRSTTSTLRASERS